MELPQFWPSVSVDSSLGIEVEYIDIDIANLVSVMCEQGMDEQAIEETSLSIDHLLVYRDKKTGCYSEEWPQINPEGRILYESFNSVDSQMVYGTHLILDKVMRIHLGSLFHEAKAKTKAEEVFESLVNETIHHEISHRADTSKGIDPHSERSDYIRQVERSGKRERLFGAAALAAAGLSFFLDKTPSAFESGIRVSALLAGAVLMWASYGAENQQKQNHDPSEARATKAEQRPERLVKLKLRPDIELG